MPRASATPVPETEVNERGDLGRATHAMLANSFKEFAEGGSSVATSNSAITAPGCSRVHVALPRGDGEIRPRSLGSAVGETFDSSRGPPPMCSALVIADRVVEGRPERIGPRHDVLLPVPPEMPTDVLRQREAHGT